MKTTKTKVSAIECPTCKDVIYSRARHDFHYCGCGEVAIDGGFEYVRISYKNVIPQTIHITVNASKDDLYDDWNFRKDKFGVIKKLTSKKKNSKVKTLKGKTP